MMVNEDILCEDGNCCVVVKSDARSEGHVTLLVSSPGNTERVGLTRDEATAVRDALSKWIDGSRRAYADCRRCGEPAHPIRGYCGRFCEEATAADEAMRASGPEVWRKPGTVTHIANLDAPSRGAEGAFAAAYAEIERDMADTLAESLDNFNPRVNWTAVLHGTVKE